jgi:lipid-A-disaccharide synthase
MKALIVAGEASGDLYGGRLASALKLKFPNIELAGMGGGQMTASGVQLLQHYGDVTVVGVFEVASKLRKLRRAMVRIQDWITANRPDFAVLIDFPDFNFRLAAFLKKQGIRVFYFISPQIWAWRKNRIHFLKDNVDLMLCVLPFEKGLYENAGVPVEYVGHPLVEIVREQVAQQPVFARAETPLVGIMPGSRDVEMRRHLSVLVSTLEVLQRQVAINSLLIWPPSLDPSIYNIHSNVLIVKENRYAAMKACDLMIVASGTSTLECAILNVPMMIVYRVSGVSWQLGKVLVRVPYYGLVNWIAGEKKIPEYIQSRMNPELLAADAAALLKDRSRRERMKQDLVQIVDSLGTPGAIDRAVTAIAKKVS